MICCYEMSQSMEVVSNLRPRKNLDEGSTHGLSTLIFGRTFSLFTKRISCEKKESKIGEVFSDQGGTLFLRARGKSHEKRRNVMRKIIVFNIISLDGYHTGPGNNVMVMPMGGVFDAYTIERLRAAETVLLGRVTYEMFRSFWPSVADDPSPEWTPAQREMSRFNNALDTIVVSDTMTTEHTEPWHNTRIIMRADG